MVVDMIRLTRMFGRCPEETGTTLDGIRGMPSLGRASRPGQRREEGERGERKD